MIKKNFNRFFIFSSVSLFSGLSLAVTTRNCPEKLSVKVLGIEVNENKDEALKDFSLGLGAPSEASLEDKYEDKVYLSAEMVYETLKAGDDYAPWLSRTFSISKRENGVCQYTSQENPLSDDKIEVYTSGQKDRIYLQTLIGPRGSLLRTYAVISEMSPSSLSVEAGPYGVAAAVPRSPYVSYRAGGPLGFLAKAEKFEVTVAP